MKKIRIITDKKESKKFLEEKILPLYDDYKQLIKVNMVFHKNIVLKSKYHIVVEFQIEYLNVKSKEVNLSVFASAHSCEERKNSFDALKYLNLSGFADENLLLPRELLYLDDINIVFYQGVAGESLYDCIKNKDIINSKRITENSARWLAKLHQIDENNFYNKNYVDSSIDKVFPGVEYIYDRIKKDYPAQFEKYFNIYEKLKIEDLNLLRNDENITLIHGDAHPGNFIDVGRKKIAAIDLSDLCLADFARDLGTFLQQLNFMSFDCFSCQEVKLLKDIFLNQYLNVRGMKIDDKLRARIEIYYNWTAMRTATYFIELPSPESEKMKQILNNTYNLLFNEKKERSN